MPISCLYPGLWFTTTHLSRINSLRPRPNRRHFADDIFKCIFENENEWISHSISLKFLPRVRINNFPALVQIMAWHRPGDKPLSEPMMVSLLTHICVTRPQWVKLTLLQQTCTDFFKLLLWKFYMGTTTGWNHPAQTSWSFVTHWPTIWPRH